MLKDHVFFELDNWKFYCFPLLMKISLNKSFSTLVTK